MIKKLLFVLSILCILLPLVLVGCDSPSDPWTDPVYYQDLHVWDGAVWNQITTNGGGGGVTDFTDLGDVPNSYVGSGGQVVAVNVAENALEFIAAPGGGNVSSAANITDHSIVRGDGGAMSVQDSGITIDDADNLDTNGGDLTGFDVNADNDVNVTNNLDVDDDAGVGGDLTVTGAITSGGVAVIIEGDVRLSDSRNPLAHASTHDSGGSDQVHSIADNDDDTKIQVEEAADEDKIRFDTGGTERSVLDSTGLTAPHSITDNYVVTVDDAGVADNEYAKFTANGVEGRTSAEVLGDIGAADTSHGATHTNGTDDVATVVGDAGAGGTKGLVPAPGAGDTAAGKYLKADGTWTTPPDTTGGDVATDAIWDAAGDLAVGTGANTAAKVNIGAEEVVGRIGVGNVDGIAVAEQTVLGRVTGGSIDDLPIGITDDDILQVDQADAADNDFAKFTANGLEGRSSAETKQDLSLDNVENTAHSTDAHTMTIDGRDVSTDGSKLDGIEAGADVTDATNVDAAGAVMESDYDADSVLTATNDNTPVNTTLAEQTVLGRLTGGHPDDLPIGITDDDLLQADDATIADNDYAKFTANGVEGVAKADVITDLAVLKTADIDDTPVNGETAAPISSNWAFDHNASKSDVHGLISYQGRNYQIFNPYVPKANSYKGQLHSHSTGSDGADSPANLADAYHTAGYNFLCITDHNVLTADPGHSGLLCIPSVEESGSGSWHINSFGVTAQTAETDPQEELDDIYLDGGIAQINHPDWASTLIPLDGLVRLTDYALIEIRNSFVGDAVGDTARETKWDSLLTAGRPVWGVTADDCHNIAGANFNKFFVVVYADSLTATNIKVALRDGNFYCANSTNSPVPTVTLSGSTLTITTNINADFTFIGRDGLTLQTTTNNTTATYTITGKERYVRCRMVKNGSTETSWTQPIILTSIGNLFENSSLVNDHSDAVLSTLVHNNNNYFIGYYNETVADIPYNVKLKQPTLTTINDPVLAVDTSDWYGASGAYTQADNHDCSATNIHKASANFTSSIITSIVKWASNAAGDADIGVGIVTARPDTGNLTISKCSGTNFANSYYFWIKHSEWVVPVTGVYFYRTASYWVPAEADKYYISYLYRYAGTDAPDSITSGIMGAVDATRCQVINIGVAVLTAGDHVFGCGNNLGTAGTPDMYGGVSNAFQLFLLKQTG